MGETAYLIANASVAPVWLLMIFAPTASITERMTRTPLVPALYAVLYSCLLIGSFVLPGEGSMSSLADLRIAFERDLVLLLAWVHYLSFDMVVGMWEYRDARKHGLSWWAVGPCMAGTLMFGPFGMLAYVVLRRVMAGQTDWEAP